MEIILNNKTNPAYLISAGMIWLGASASSHAAVMINEIDYDQVGSDTAEFIELFNPDINLVALDGYTLDLIIHSICQAYLSLRVAILSCVTTHRLLPIVMSM